jgi:tyrosyl-tRNA synthetase
LIGDPSDKDKLRPQLTAEQIAENGQTYADQAFRILDPEKTQIRYNAEWLSTLSFADLIRLASNFTVQQFMQRENFKLRCEKGDPVYLHETFYALMQGYDAFTLKADVQVGGTDQLFNIVTAARKVMTFMGAKPNVAIILGILPGTDGVIKMSKSLGNGIPLNSQPEDMYGKVMSIPDEAMVTYMALVTRWTPGEIAQMSEALKVGKVHPRDIKMQLAWEIVSSLFDAPSAIKAEESFIQLFQQRQAPDSMPMFPYQAQQSILEVLLATGLIASKSEGKRLLAQKGVRLDGVLLEDGQAPLPDAGILQVGKRKYARITR